MVTSDSIDQVLEKDLRDDVNALLKVLKKCGEWNASKDAKLEALYSLLVKKHPTDKIIVFSQFADTVYYLESQLLSRGVKKLAGVTGDSPIQQALLGSLVPLIMKSGMSSNRKMN